MSQPQYNLPTDPKVAKSLIENETEKHRLSLGWFGKWFGSSQNAAVYLVGTICFVLLLIVAVLGVVAGRENIQFISDLFKVVLPVITTLVGFILGQSGKDK